jgi:FkbM family methyltransferase
LDYKSNGFFLEIGAYDGIQTSNTYALEKFLNWDGICIEANTEVFGRLKQNRSRINVHTAVSNYDGVCNFGGDRINGGPTVVNCYTLDTILTQNNAPKEIDYISIDVEGHELAILSSFNFKNWDIKLFTIEHNLYCDGPAKKDSLFKLLTENNFTRVLDNALCLDKNPDYFNQPYEDWYVNNDYLLALNDNIKKFKQ